MVTKNKIGMLRTEHKHSPVHVSTMAFSGEVVSAYNCKTCKSEGESTNAMEIEWKEKR